MAAIPSTGETAPDKRLNNPEVKCPAEKARKGKVRNFIGIGSSCDAKKNPQAAVDTNIVTAEQAAGQVIACVRGHGFIRVDTVPQ